jgi:hypothetical protein
MACLSHYSPQLFQKFRRLAEQDKIGNPITRSFYIPARDEVWSDEKNTFDTYRYDIVASEHVPKFLYELMLIEKAFSASSPYGTYDAHHDGNDNSGFDGYNIIEIGGGYGGLVNTFSEYHNINSYTIVDLGTVNLLINKYLKKINSNILKGDRLKTINANEHEHEHEATATDFNVNVNVNVDVDVDANKPHINNNNNNNIIIYDLFISCWCLSEQKKHTFDEYLNKYIKNSKRGFIQLNYDDYGTKDKHAIENGDMYNIIEIFKLIYTIHDSAVLLPPPPCYVWGNHRITWGPNVGIIENININNPRLFNGQVPNWG